MARDSSAVCLIVGICGVGGIESTGGGIGDIRGIDLRGTESRLAVVKGAIGRTVVGLSISSVGIGGTLVSSSEIIGGISRQSAHMPLQ